MKKIYFLYLLFYLTTAAFAFFLGKLDFFGFLDGRHIVNLKLLIGALFSSYFLTLTVVLIDLGKSKEEYFVYAAATVLFAIIFAFINGNGIAALFAGLQFVIFCWIISTQAKNRIELFVKLVPSELITPILKNGFLFVIGMFAIINFFQSQSRITSRTLISPEVVKTITKPFVTVFNRQLENQLRSELGTQYNANQNTAAKKQVVEYVLKQTIQSTLNSKVLNLQIPSDNIPVDQTIFYKSGAIDISPVVNQMAGDIASTLNIKLLPFTVMAPFIVALATIIIFQPLFWPIELFENYLSGALFFLLLKSKFISIRKETREVERIQI